MARNIRAVRFLLFIFSIFVCSIVWWVIGHRLLSGLPRARAWRSAVAALMGLNLLGFAWVIGTRMAGARDDPPVPILATTLIWHVAALPIGMALFTLVGLSAAASWWRRQRHSKPIEAHASAAPGHLSRRQLLHAAAVAAPPMVLGAGLTKAFAERNAFRVRRMDIAQPNLPRELDGLTIVQVSDLHIGHFTRGEVLKEIVRRSNELRADLVAVTGDIIDHDLADLNAGIDLMQRLDSRHGVFACEGNHDLFESRVEFESRVKRSGIPLLLNEVSTIRVRGVPIQMAGIRWGNSNTKDSGVEVEVAKLRPHLDPGVFKILLAHHPHAWDYCKDDGIALTLSGHSHGGQMMLTENLGFGPALFRYWTGQYRRPNGALFVSNGVGNWFPLRLNAPAEIVHLTLRRGEA
jgi:predicted MPP superfamily phosphohydrolase